MRNPSQLAKRKIISGPSDIEPGVEINLRLRTDYFKEYLKPIAASAIPARRSAAKRAERRPKSEPRARPRRSAEAGRRRKLLNATHKAKAAPKPKAAAKKTSATGRAEAKAPGASRSLGRLRGAAATPGEYCSSRRRRLQCLQCDQTSEQLGVTRR